MATKLKKLKLTSVDLVKRGANQDADICLYKSDTEPQEDEPTPGMMRAFFQKCADFFKKADEDVEKYNHNHGAGGRFSSAAGGGTAGGAAGGGDNSPRGYKAAVRNYRSGYTSGRFGADKDPNFKEKQAAGKEIFDRYDKKIKADPASAKTELQAEHKNYNTQADSARKKMVRSLSRNDYDGALKYENDESMARNKMHVLELVADAAGFKKSAPEEVEKEAKSFDNITCGRKKREKIWKYTEALNESFMSAMNEEDMSDQEKKAFMQESLAQFTEAMGKLINDFSDEEPDIKVEMTKAAPEEGQPDSENIPQNKEGVKKTMKFNTSNMTQEEALAFEQLLAKAEPMPEEEGKEEEKEASCKTKKVDKSDNQESDILKSAMERLEILEKGIELNKYKEIAKRYEVLGEKEEELANTLYSLAKSDEANYNAYIAVLDKSLDVVNKSGIFMEIGKSGNGTGSEPNTTTGKIEKAAQEIMKADPQISREEAMIKAWDENPDLIREYETEYKGN